MRFLSPSRSGDDEDPSYELILERYKFVEETLELVLTHLR